MRVRTILCVIAAVAAGGCLLAQPGCNKGSGRGGGNFPVVEIETSAGTIRVELWPDKAPKTVENFLMYVDEGAYDNTIFHRCFSGSLIQGGGFTPDWKVKPTHPPIRNEADSGLRNVRSTLAMARTDNPHSATNQFFINTVDHQEFDHEDKTAKGWGYCVFGQVISGIEVVDAISLAPTVGPEEDGKPARPVIIKSIRRLGSPRKTGPVPAKKGSGS